MQSTCISAFHITDFAIYKYKPS